MGFGFSHMGDLDKRGIFFISEACPSDGDIVGDDVEIAFEVKMFNQGASMSFVDLVVDRTLSFYIDHLFSEG
jgi:hypothetical protein